MNAAFRLLNEGREASIFFDFSPLVVIGSRYRMLISRGIPG